MTIIWPYPRPATTADPGACAESSALRASAETPGYVQDTTYQVTKTTHTRERITTVISSKYPVIAGLNKWEMGGLLFVDHVMADTAAHTLHNLYLASAIYAEPAYVNSYSTKT